MTRVIGSSDRATAGAQSVAFYAKLLVLDGDARWRDLTALDPDFLNWFVSASWSADIDEPVMSARFTVVREAWVSGSTRNSLAPQMSASPYNRNGANQYSPLLNPGRQIRLLTATIAPGGSPGPADWKRVFDGKIDGADPGGDDGTIVLRCRDRGAWLLDTSIEAVRHYGDAAHSVSLEAMIQQIINDNAIPGRPQLYTPIASNWYPDQRDINATGSVLTEIRKIAQEIGWDLRYFFLDDGDVDPRLVLYAPPRTKTTPDWSFAPTEYIAVPQSELNDDNTFNAVSVKYMDTTLNRVNTITSINSTSINQFGRRWFQVGTDNTQNIHDQTTAQRLADAIVSDLSSPVNQHSMETLFAWFLSISDLVRYQPNAVHYDAALDLAVTHFEHTLEAGSGTTTVNGRGTPAGAYKQWLQLISPGDTPSVIVTTQVVTETETQITLQVDAVVVGSVTQPVVAFAWSSTNPPVTKVSGADAGVWVANHSQWTFAKPPTGSSAAAVGFYASATGAIDASVNVAIMATTSTTAPTLAAPTITPDVSGQTFAVTWAAASPEPSGDQYYVGWRATPTDSWTTSPLLPLSPRSFTVTQAMHHRVLASAAPPGVAATFQAFVAICDASGNLVTAGPLGQVAWYDNGPVSVDTLVQTPNYSANNVSLSWAGHGAGIASYDVYVYESEVQGPAGLPAFAANVSASPFVYALAKDILSNEPQPNHDDVSFYVVAKDASGNVLATSSTNNLGHYGWGGSGATGTPSIDAPTVNVNLTTQSFDIAWTPHNLNLGTTGFTLFFRLTPTDAWTSVYASGAQSASLDKTWHHRLLLAGAPGIARTFQCYVEGYDSTPSPAVTVDSPITAATYYDGGAA